MSYDQPDQPDPTMDGGQVPPAPPREAMTKDDIRDALDREVQAALYLTNGTIRAEQEKALEYYYGRPFGNEVAGRSQVVLADVAETIDWIMPSLMRIFFSSSKIVRFDPNHSGAEDEAKIKTDWCNFKFLRQLKGKRIIHDFLKSALLEKRGFISVYADEYSAPVWDEYENIPEVQFAIMAANAQIEGHEFVNVSMREAPGMGPPGPNGEPPQPTTNRLYNFRLKKIQTETRICVENFTSDEFLIAPRAPDIDTRTPFCGRKMRRSKSELLSYGYDPKLIEELTAEDPNDDSSGLRTARFMDEDGGTDNTPDREGPSQEVWVVEGYLRIDADGDGYTELHRIVAGGGANGVGAILEDDLVSDIGYVSSGPYPMHGKFWGRSLADLVVDLQLIRSTLMRQMLDHAYLTINPRMAVLDGEVNTDDLLVSRPGGIVRESIQGAVRPLEMAQLGAAPFNLFEQLQEERENRAGSTRYNQGQDASSLNQTARGISAIMTAAQARVVLIAELIAEDLKRLFKLMVACMARSGIKREVMQVAGKWVEFDPSTWSEELDCTMQIGVPVGQTAEIIGYLTQILQAQKELQLAGLGFMVPPSKVFSALQKMTDTMGFQAEEMFFMNPHDQMPPPPPPSPDEMKIQVQQQKNQADSQNADAQLVLNAKSIQTDSQLKQAQIASNMQAQMEQIASAERIALAELKSKEKMEREKLAAEMALEREKMASAEKIAREKPAPANGAVH